MPSLYTQRRHVEARPVAVVTEQPRRDLQTALTNAGLQQ